jgi:hypothetical protein
MDDTNNIGDENRDESNNLLHTNAPPTQPASNLNSCLTGSAIGICILAAIIGAFSRPYPREYIQDLDNGMSIHIIEIYQYFGSQLVSASPLGEQFELYGSCERLPDESLDRFNDRLWENYSSHVPSELKLSGNLWVNTPGMFKYEGTEHEYTRDQLSALLEVGLEHICDR